MNNLIKGLIAGIVATLVLSILMIIKAKMGMMPDLNVITMLASKMGGNPMLGWIAHIVIGLGYGIVIALLFNKLPSDCGMIKGMVLGVLGWLVMMLVVMPMMGAGVFALNMGIMAAVATLVLHLIFGAVLGGTYQKLTR